LPQPTINHKLRIKRLTAGMTECQLAEAVARLVSAQTGHKAALDGNYVSKLERGRITWPNSVYRRALRELFDAATDAELGFYAARTRRDAERWLSGPPPADAAPRPSAALLPAVRPAATIAVPAPETGAFARPTDDAGRWPR